MKIVFLLLLTGVMFSAKLLAQADTLICFDCQTGQIATIPPSPNSSNRGLMVTAWNLGMTPGIAALPKTKPENTMSNSGFTAIVPAQSMFRVTDFPLRTMVQLFEYAAGVPQPLCTGTMIGPRWVLSAAHAVFDRKTHDFIDSILIAPAYDNGAMHPEFGNCRSQRFYIPKNFYGTSISFWDDIALIELTEPLGNTTGWIGIAGNHLIEINPDQVLHQFGYPKKPPYTGDTLYYGYGTLNVMDDIFGIGYYGMAKGGQSGSSLIQSDNQSWYSIGTLHGVTDRGEAGKDVTFHCPITESKFYAFRNIIENNTTTIPDPGERPVSQLELQPNYPNPFNPSTTIGFTMHKAGSIRLKIYNITGQEVAVLIDKVYPVGEHQVQWLAEGLPGGIYLACLQMGAERKTRKLIFQK